MAPRSHINLTGSEPQQPTARKLFSTPPTPRNPEQPSSLGPSPMSLSSSSPSITTNGTQRSTLQQNPPPHAPAIAPPSTPGSSHPPPPPTAAPKTRDAATVRLELMSVRREVGPLIRNHNKLVDELQALGAPVPQKFLPRSRDELCKSKPLSVAFFVVSS